jgi:hypothetical protein
MEDIIAGIRHGWKTMAAIIAWGLLAILIGTIVEFLFTRPKGPK